MQERQGFLTTSGPLAEGAGLAHDAGNLLGALTLYCDLLDRPGVLRPEHQHYSRELRLLAERSSTLIGRLIQNNLESLAHEAFPAPTADPGEALLSLEPVLRRMAAPVASLTLTTQRSLRKPATLTIESLERVAINLVSNAVNALVSAGRHDGHIAVTLAASPTRLTMTVADNGPGMNLLCAAQAVSPFCEEAPSTLRRHGLGLHIVHELAEDSGASFEIHARRNQSTAITLSWPLTQQPLARHAPANKLSKGAAAHVRR
ncbi:MAG: ATP-binding protein [Acidobacteriaceae bacterium]|nr:ATP-binding protein [Acidobacteriaceae bacterium]